MNASRHFTKQRFLWQPDAWRLLRERNCADYARQVMPSTVDGMRIQFPETTVALMGPCVVVTTQAIDGQALFDLLYEPAKQMAAVTIGLVALEAWQRAQIVGHPFPFFSTVFRLVKGPRVLLHMCRSSKIVSSDQRREFCRLVAFYARAESESRVLVHGDMHASHLLVNLASSSLGFIDLETVHVGKPATNFAQLWIGYHYADPRLGQTFYREYVARFPDMMSAEFDNDVRAELAIRCHRHVCDGMRTGNQDMESKARTVLAAVLSGTPFGTSCLSGRLA